jgi:hypothetical protein
MKSFLYIIAILISFSFCADFEGIHGVYVKKGKDYQYRLTVNKDTTFVLITQSIHARSECKGKWQLVGDTLLLKCNEEPFPAQITKGYMTEREKKVIVLNEKRMKLGQVVMKRTKE